MADKFCVRIAGLTIGVEAHYSHLRSFFGEYLSQGEPDFSVSWTEEEIAAEHDGMKAVGQTGSYSMEYLETLAALRKISDILPKYNRFLMHGACISCDDKGYLFTAPSGTGKTTHISLWKKYLSDRIDIVNGDKPILSVEDGTVTVYGTPWAGKEKWQKNRSVKLDGLCFLERGGNYITGISPEDCLERLFHQVYISREEPFAGKTLELLDEMLTLVPLYLLHCDISEGSVRTSFEAMTGNTYVKKA
ncbi:MAG: hypothetical protein LUG86_06755 [Oscillospiraceae bacterium]|nr:hypothetical protein [Oscillospiraceae bacterium]